MVKVVDLPSDYLIHNTLLNTDGYCIGAWSDSSSGDDLELTVFVLNQEDYFDNIEKHGDAFDKALTTILGIKYRRPHFRDFPKDIPVFGSKEHHEYLSSFEAFIEKHNKVAQKILYQTIKAWLENP